MLIPFWFKTNTGLGYGVTAESKDHALRLLSHFGYPLHGQIIIDVASGVTHGSLDQNHVAPNAGPMAIRGIWFPRHNI
jgi:hypothetical protein